MKSSFFIKAFIFSFFALNCSAGNPENTVSKVMHLTDVGFKQKVFNYELNQQWKYQGNLPAIIDFYADWCAPCRRISPIIEEIAREYAGKIIVYKVDTEVEQNLTASLGISSLPTLIFIPKNGQPQASVGAVTKETLIKAINEVLLIK